MLEILLPNDIVIAAGWYPEGSLAGAYRIIVFQGERDLVPPVLASTVDRAVRDINGFVDQFKNTKRCGSVSVPAEDIQFVGSYGVDNSAFTMDAA